jgi:DNA polymerase III delta prime subunit
MNTPFLKKYKPKFYNEFIIDNEYIHLLDTLIKMDTLNILLIGNTSCGKSSLLDATIREYYKLDKIPRDNVLYINNLQEQGISYYRSEVKTFCRTPSSISGKKKFIVLDDIDTINEQSQQVFRNCIDKYSHNVNFIASCCNTQKVVESIQSRITLIKLKPATKEILKKILNKIKENEKIIISNYAQEFILNVCNNSLRLLINYMEKFNLLDEKITISKAKEICTNISYFDLEKYTNEWYINKSLQNAIKIIYNIFDKGYSVMDILDSYFQFIKITNILNEKEKYKIISIICKYISLFHTLHENEIELTFITNDLIINI